jgi:hypothetical protein
VSLNTVWKNTLEFKKRGRRLEAEHIKYFRPFVGVSRRDRLCNEAVIRQHLGETSFVNTRLLRSTN